ncbi:MAG: hypothetical protein QOJ64_1275 [Acidobacteriota bacterium]|nr:hypothetical protein [Acidobacteriota bacterium]
MATAAAFAVAFAAQAVVGNVGAVVAQEERMKWSAVAPANQAATSRAEAADIGPRAEARLVRWGSTVSPKSEALLPFCSDRAYA